MILVESVTCPDWMAGAAHLQARQRTIGNGAWHWIGSPIILPESPDWRPLDGDRIALIGHDPATLLRPRAGGYMWAEVEDSHGRIWCAPRIVSANDERLFAIAYGPGWEPQATPDQERLLAICDEIRSAGAKLPRPVACQFAAEMLCAINHLSVGAIQALGLMDDVLASSCLECAVSMGYES
jgi:hypothetical protein